MKIRINYTNCGWKNGKCQCDNGCKCGCDIMEDCIGCAEVCPVNAITRKNKVIIDNKKCIKCGACVTACPNNAISLI